MRRRTWGGSAARLRRCLRSLQHAAGRGVLRCQKRSLPSSYFGTACGVAGSFWGKFGDKRIKRGGQASHGDLQRVETRQMPAHGRDISSTAAGAGACKGVQITKKARARSFRRGNEYQDLAGEARRCGVRVRADFWRVERLSPEKQRRAHKDEPALARRAQGPPLHGHNPAPRAPRARVK